jgi:hypothetical protein
MVSQSAHSSSGVPVSMHLISSLRGHMSSFIVQLMSGNMISSILSLMVGILMIAGTGVLLYQKLVIISALLFSLATQTWSLYFVSRSYH